MRRRIDELNAMAQKAKCASGWKVTISASPQPSSSSDRSASDRLGSSSSYYRPHWRPRHLARMPPCRPVRLSSALSSRKLVLSRPHHVDRTFISWSANFFFMGAYMHLMYVFVWRGGGSTQTNIVRLKQNVDNWRRPLIDHVSQISQLPTANWR